MYRVDERCVLGRLFDLRAMEERTLEDRLAKAWRAFRANQDGISCKQVPTALGLRYLNVAVRPTVVWGLVVTDPTAACLDALSNFHDNMIRRALGLFKGDLVDLPRVASRSCGTAPWLEVHGSYGQTPGGGGRLRRHSGWRGVAN